MHSKITFAALLFFISQSAFAQLTKIDSVISNLNGCWQWDHYFGGFAGLPPTAATDDVHVEFFQDAQDSSSHTVSCRSYKDSVLEFTGRCAVTTDTLGGYNTLSCPLFDSVGIVGSPPIYFNFENDTLLFPQQEFVDGFVYGFLKNCEDTITHTEYPDEEGVSIYPNPASERVVIRTEGNEPKLLSLYNSVGRKLATYQFQSQSDRTIDVSKFPEGVYFITIMGSQRLQTRKLIIQR